MNIFRTKIKITIINRDGRAITQSIVGSKRKIRKEIDRFKQLATTYFMMGEDEMIVLV